MPEIISGGMGFGGMRLNGQIIHYQGLRDTQSVVMPGTSDSFPVSDSATVLSAYVDAMSFSDVMGISVVQAEAVEVLSTNGGLYHETDSISFTDAASKT